MEPELQHAKPANCGTIKCVVLDTNTWRSHLFLKDSIGRALVYRLGRQGCFIALPEIVEMELKCQLFACLNDAKAKSERPTQMICTLTGAFPFAFPDDAKIKTTFDEWMKDLDSVLLRVPFTIEHAKAALNMVINKLPPNKEQEQFRDSAIWQATLSLCPNYSVYFVTNDRAFFHDKSNPTLGLAENLNSDCKILGRDIQVFSDLGKCLESLTKEKPEFDQSRVTQQIEGDVRSRIVQVAKRTASEIGDKGTVQMMAFQTDEPGRLAIDYKFEFPCFSIDSNLEGKAVARGTCYFLKKTESVNNHFINSVDLIWKSEFGQSHYYAGLAGDDPSIPFPRKRLID